MASLRETYVTGIYEVVVEYNREAHWTWKITILKNGNQLDQMRSIGVPSYQTILDHFRINQFGELSGPALDMINKIVKKVPYNELG